MIRTLSLLSAIAFWLLIGPVGAAAQSGHRVTATVVGEVMGQPDAEVFDLNAPDENPLEIAFHLPTSMQGRDVLKAVLQLRIDPLSDAEFPPAGRLFVEIIGDPTDAIFGERTLGSRLREGSLVKITANDDARGVLSKMDGNQVVITLTGVEHGFFGPAAVGEAGIDTRYRPRLVVTFDADGTAPTQAVSDRSSLTGARVWPNRAPDRVHLMPLATEKLRSYRPVFVEDQAVVLLGDEGSAKLTGISVSDGRTVWSSDRVKGSGQHLFALPDSQGFGLLGNTESYAFARGKKPARELKIESKARGTTKFVLNHPPVIGPNGQLYLADSSFLSGIDVNGRELWRVPFRRTGPMTLTGDSLYLIAMTNEGLRVIDTRSGDMIEVSEIEQLTGGTNRTAHCASPRPDQAQYDLFNASSAAPETSLLGPVSMVLRRDSAGRPTARRIFASLVGGNANLTGYFDLTQPDEEAATLAFAGLSRGILSAGLPDAKVPEAEGCEGARSLFFVTERAPSITLGKTDWWSGAFVAKEIATNVALPELAAAAPVRSGRDRVFLPAENALVVWSREDSGPAGLARIEVVPPPSGGLISPRLLLSETGGLFVMDDNAETRRLWAAEAGFDLGPQDNAICSPMAARLAGSGKDGLRITSSVAVRLGPSTTFGPDTQIGIGTCE